MAQHNNEYLPQLMTRVLASLHAVDTHGLARMKLNAPAARVLVVLLKNGAMRVSRLAEQVALEPTGLSHLMRILEQRRLIARERQPEDHRAVIVSLTAAGRAQARLCAEMYAQCESSLLRNLPETDVLRLRGVLEQMLANAGLRDS